MSQRKEMTDKGASLPVNAMIPFPCLKVRNESHEC